MQRVEGAWRHQWWDADGGVAFDASTVEDDISSPHAVLDYSEGSGPTDTRTESARSPRSSWRQGCSVHSAFTTC